MIFAYSLLFLGLIVGAAQAQNCNLLSVCPIVDAEIPECKTDVKSDGTYKCIEGILKDCHTNHDITASFQLVKKTNDAFCKDTALNKDYKDLQRDKCWSEMRSCSSEQISSLFKDKKEETCTQHRKIKDECLPSSSSKCKSVNQRFLDAAYATCDGCQHFLHFAGFVGALMLSYMVQRGIE